MTCGFDVTFGETVIYIICIFVDSKY